MIKVALCDDVEERIDEKIEYLKFCKEELPIEWDVFSLRKAYSKEIYYRVMEFAIFIIHVDMQERNGVDFANMIRSRNKNALIILMAENSEDVLHALDAVVFNFLEEPIARNDFYEMLERATDYLGENKQNFRFRVYREEISISQDSILFFEKIRRKVRIYTLYGIKECYMTTSQIMEQLNQKKFSRCHQSFIVNLSFIEKVGTDIVELKNGTEIDVSRTYKRQIKDRYFHYIAKKVRFL